MPIRKSGGSYKIDNVKGSQPTRAAAERQLRAIKASQERRKKKRRKG